jgi:quercetin dioxygenase-like cupin family protein
MRLELIPRDEGDAVDEDAWRERLLQEGFDVCRWRDEAGADYPPHSHDHDESLWIVEGEMVFSAAGRELRLRAGDRLMLPKGTVHTARAGGDGVTYLIGERP